MPHIPQPPSLKSKSRVLWVAPELKFGIKDLIRGVKFYSKNICMLNQIRYPKRPLFQVKSQKNDTIGYATLIAPEISSEIKLGMYISLLCAHMGLVLYENLHYYARECCHCSVTGCPPV